MEVLTMIKCELSSLSTFIPSSHPYLSGIRLLLHELDKLQREDGQKPRLRILELEKGTQLTHYLPADVKLVETFMANWNLYPTRLGIAFDLTKPDFVVKVDEYPKSLYDWYVNNLEVWLAENRPKKTSGPKDSPTFYRYAFGNEKSEEYLELVSAPKGMVGKQWHTKLSGSAYVRYDYARQAWELYKEQGTLVTLTAIVNTIFGPGAFDEPELAGTVHLNRQGNAGNEADTIERVQMWLTERAASRIARLITKDHPGIKAREQKRLARTWGHYLQESILSKITDQTAELVDKSAQKS